MDGNRRKSERIMIGRIIKGIAGFYYVHVEACGIYECKAKGIFRNQKVKPLVGDYVEINILSEQPKEGSIIKILQRKSELIRPAIANADQAVLLFALTNPEPNFNLLDRFLVLMEWQKLPVILCFNKSDLVSEEEAAAIMARYTHTGYPVVGISAANNTNLEPLKQMLRGKTTTLAGPSGVGKSTLVNLLHPEAAMETGDISRKIQRGKHTTRHSELFFLEHETYLFDTPGFSSLYVNEIEANELCSYFPEMKREENGCRFTGCVHMNEPDCAVKQAVAEKRISISRYENYKQMYQELKAIRKY